MSHGKSLIRGFPDSHPEHGDMVGHQTEHGACDTVPEQRISEQFTESIEKSSVQPAGLSIKNRHRPVNYRLSPISRRIKASEMIAV